MSVFVIDTEESFVSAIFASSTRVAEGEIGRSTDKGSANENKISSESSDGLTKALLGRSARTALCSLLVFSRFFLSCFPRG
jgi:hypothetical protein